MKSFICFTALAIIIFSVPARGESNIAESMWPMVQHDMFHTGQSISYGLQLGKAVVKFSTDVTATGISAPVIDYDGTVYLGSGTGCIYAITPEGAAVCIYGDVTGAIESTPVLSDDGILYAGSTSGMLYAITTDGMKKWTLQLGEPILSSPVIGSDNTVFVGSGPSDDKAEGFLHCIGSNGEKIWSYETDAVGYSSPAIDQYGNIYVGTVKGILYAIDQDGILLWTFNAADSITSSPVISPTGSILFTTASSLVALDQNGNLQWSPFIPKAVIFETEEDSGFVASPAVDMEGNIYAGGILGDMHCLDDAGREQWRVMIKDPTLFDPVPASIISAPILDKTSQVYVRSKNCAYSINRQNGTVAGAIDINPESTLENASQEASPSLGTRRTLYVGSADGKLYAVTPEERILQISGSISGDLPDGITVFARGTAESSEEYFAEITDTGQYTVEDLYPGTYIVSPFKQGLKFVPPSQKVRLTLTDKQDINFKAEPSGPDIISAQADPTRIPNDAVTPVLLTAQVSHLLGQSNIASVKVDLSEISGSAGQDLKDDGTQGDKAAGDGIYSYSTVVSPDVALGLKGLLVVATDIQGLTARKVIRLEIDNEVIGITGGEYRILIAGSIPKLIVKYSLTGTSVSSVVTFAPNISFETAPGFMLQLFSPANSVTPYFEDTITAQLRKHEIINPVSGMWRLKVIQQDGAPDTKDERVSKVLASSSQGYKLSTTTAGTGIVFGSITEAETGNPVESVSIVTTTGGNGSSQDGYYLILSPAGVFTITASDAGHVPASKSVNLMSGSSVETNIILQLKSSGSGDNGTCVFSSVFSQQDNTLEFFRRFRDTVLRKTALGTAYIEKYYYFTPELVSLLYKYPGLREHIHETVLAMLPVISQWTYNEPVMLEDEQLCRIRQCLIKIKEKGSISLRREIDKALTGLENGQLLKDLRLH